MPAPLALLPKRRGGGNAVKDDGNQSEAARRIGECGADARGSEREREQHQIDRAHGQRRRPRMSSPCAQALERMPASPDRATSRVRRAPPRRPRPATWQACPCSTTSAMTESHGSCSSRALTADECIARVRLQARAGAAQPWNAKVASEYTSASITTLAIAAFPGLFARSPGLLVDVDRASQPEYMKHAMNMPPIKPFVPPIPVQREPLPGEMHRRLVRAQAHAERPRQRPRARHIGRDDHPLEAHDQLQTGMANAVISRFHAAPDRRIPPNVVR